MAPIDSDTLANLKAPSTTPSLAATFPPFRTPRYRRNVRELPIPERLTRVAHRLAHRGAMEPEGCTGEELIRTRNLHRLPAETIKDVLRTLWAFRLLGFHPSDTLGRSYDEITEAVGGS